MRRGRGINWLGYNYTFLSVVHIKGGNTKKTRSTNVKRLPAYRRPSAPARTPAQLDIPIGTMMELPRACMTADEIVGTESVEFMSFGTNVRRIFF